MREPSARRVGSRPPLIASVIGTRPEAIKMAPVIKRLEGQAAACRSLVVSTAQHREMLDPVLARFSIRAEHDLELMRPEQTPSQLTSRALAALEPLLCRLAPDVVLVHGDTTTAFAASLAAFHQRIPVAHVEAGLRSFDFANPFPEEANRRLVSVLARFHFAPTAGARNNLLREGIAPERVWVTGNTVVDAVRWIESTGGTDAAVLPAIGTPRLVLVTAHRRENWGAPLRRICEALRELVERQPDVTVVYPVHLNPRVRETVQQCLASTERVVLCEPLEYLAFVELMRRACLILTDSGGIQEEAPCFGVPVLVLRATTERPEAAAEGLATVVGTDTQAIVREAERCLARAAGGSRGPRLPNPYGDGRAAERIVATLLETFAGHEPEDRGAAGSKNERIAGEEVPDALS